MIIRESHCLGFTTGAEQTICQWMQNQGLHIYNEMNDMLMEIISLKNRVMPGPLDYKSRRIFHLALYDLDNFRSQIFEKQYLNSFDGGKELLQAATADDVALLKLAIAWVKKELFHT